MYIVTVETNLDTEVICTLDIRDKRTVEIASKEKCMEWIKDIQKIFPDSVYHLYELVEVEEK